MEYIILGLLIVIFGLIFFFYRKNQSSLKKSSSRLYRTTSRAKTNSGKSVPRKTRKQLTAMVGGDQRTVERLLKNLRLKHPGESETWYWEKAIFDLERDRRY
ncbi:MAG: hypothetical protein VKL41_05615 [Snowella sp.]|nr:hypothetical protein [Snowella sp.]